MLHLFRNVVEHMPALRTVRFVLPSTLANLCDGSQRPLLPHRRCMLRPLEHEKLERMMAFSRHLQRQRNRNSTLPSVYRSIVILPGIPPVPDTEEMRDMLEQAVIFGAQECNITFGIDLITEFCYSPSGDSRFVAAGDEFPDSPDPSVFATLNSPKPQDESENSLVSLP
ncbi:hypothetical protein F4801DRAFT_63333 [Xylaria longipes]|nr:hypothetical protein F4801DRAFT_63333 [Xylaria longipes]